MSPRTKPGVETTEAWAALTGGMSSLTALFTVSDWRVQLGAITVFGAITCTYLWSRTTCKAHQSKRDEIVVKTAQLIDAEQ